MRSFRFLRLLLLLPTCVVLLVPSSEALAARASEGSLEIPSLGMRREVVRETNVNELQQSIDLCQGVTAFPKDYAPGVTWLAAHRSGCRKPGQDGGFFGVDTLGAGDELRWTVNGVTKIYRLIDDGVVTNLVDAYTTPRPPGTTVILQTSKSTQKDLPPDQYLIHLKFLRLVNTSPATRMDVAGYDAGQRWTVGRSVGDRFIGSQPGLSNWGGADFSTLSGDFNGDGRDDIAAKDSNGTWYVALSNGYDFVPQGNLWMTQWATGDGFYLDVGDFNGDGLDDIVAKDSNGTWYVALSNGQYFVPQGGVWMTQWATGDSFDLNVGDFNGDGLDDVVAKDPNGTWYVALSNGRYHFMPQGGVWMTGWAAGGGDHVDVGDFNGDSVDDVVAKDSNGTWYVALSNGRDHFTPQGNLWMTGWATGDGYNVNVGDFNGDGTDDVIAEEPNGTWYVALSNGQWFVPQGNIWMTGAPVEDYVVGNFA